MTTINDLRQRIEDEYLEPVTEQTPTVPIVSDIDATSLTFEVVPDILSPDEESLIGPGAILELDSELVSVVSYDQTTNVVTCRRGLRSSTAVAHTAADSLVRFPTRWPRVTVETAIKSAIDSLWQPLYSPKEKIATVSTAEFVRLPLTTVRLTGVEYQAPDGSWYPMASTLFATHPTDPNFASLQLGPLPYTTTLCVIRYGVRIVAPESITEDIEDLETKWERIITTDAAAQLLSGVDIDAVTQEYLTQQLRLERFPVRSGATISQSLIRYREYLMDQARKDFKAKYPVKVQQLPVAIWG